MFILSRYIDQGATIDTPAGQIRIVIVGVDGSLRRPRVRLGISAPDEFRVLRDELAGSGAAYEGLTVSQNESEMARRPLPSHL